MKKTGMIDVSSKKETHRVAKAVALIRLDKEILEKIKRNNIPKGNVLENARTAGILAAKRTPEIIPLCHNIGIEHVSIGFLFKEDAILIESTVKSTAKTGVEMEALFSVSVSALTIYDMCKMFTKSIEIKDIYLVEKSGGKSGIYRRG
jgi:cyclic pyranopterin phosphate synthase